MLSLRNNQRGESSIIQTIMVGLLIVGAFFLGMLWTKVQTYEKSGLVPGAGAPKVAGNVPSDNAPSAPKAIPAVKADDWVRGNKNARVAFVEYSDLECPFCKRFHPTAKQLMQAYGDKIMWVYRHFPLDSIHSKARNEAAASECAGKLGGNDKFWSYIDKVYEITPGNNGLDPAKLPEIAGQLGLNVGAFTACLSKGDTLSLVSADSDAGEAAGISGTPASFFLDTKTGEVVENAGAVPYEQLKATLDQFIASRK